MADEFVKGFAILTAGLLVWMMFASWFNTPSFFDVQLLGPNPEDPSEYASIGLLVKDAMLVFSLLGALTFWILIPAGRHAREYYAAN
ncbi:DUF7314 family protein [Halomontanus rarus]|uniref:DUF7314 family protein n=1 Tax=Halomontanus rarus TaxID=3034020 RepID=UPI001A9813AF